MLMQAILIKQMTLTTDEGSDHMFLRLRVKFSQNQFTLVQFGLRLILMMLVLIIKSLASRSVFNLY